MTFIMPSIFLGFPACLIWGNRKHELTYVNTCRPHSRQQSDDGSFWKILFISFILGFYYALGRFYAFCEIRVCCRLVPPRTRKQSKYSSGWILASIKNGVALDLYFSRNFSKTTNIIFDILPAIFPCSVFRVLQFYYIDLLKSLPQALNSK